MTIEATYSMAMESTSGKGASHILLGEEFLENFGITLFAVTGFSDISLGLMGLSFCLDYDYTATVNAALC